MVRDRDCICAVLLADGFSDSRQFRISALPRLSLDASTKDLVAACCTVSLSPCVRLLLSTTVFFFLLLLPAPLACSLSLVPPFSVRATYNRKPYNYAPFFRARKKHPLFPTSLSPPFATEYFADGLSFVIVLNTMLLGVQHELDSPIGSLWTQNDAMLQYGTSSSAPGARAPTLPCLPPHLYPGACPQGHTSFSVFAE